MNEAEGRRVRLAIVAFIVVVTAHAPPSAGPRFGPARLQPQAVAREGKSRTVDKVRRGFIEAAVLEQGYQASEVASFLGCHPSNVSRALQKRGKQTLSKNRKSDTGPGPSPVQIRIPVVTVLLPNGMPWLSKLWPI